MNRGIELTTSAAIEEYDELVDKLKSNCLLYGMESIPKPKDDASCREVYESAMLGLLYAAVNEVTFMIARIESNE